MKTIGPGLFLLFFCLASSAGQANKAADHFIEGGKVVVELIKAIGGKRISERDPGCKGSYADLCVINESNVSVSVALYHRGSNDKRELVIQPELRECCLRITVGVWTYDLYVSGTSTSIRKGDILIEGCQNLIMNIKY